MRRLPKRSRQVGTRWGGFGTEVQDMVDSLKRHALGWQFGQGYFPPRPGFRGTSGYFVGNTREGLTTEEIDKLIAAVDGTNGIFYIQYYDGDVPVNGFALYQADDALLLQLVEYDADLNTWNQQGGKWLNQLENELWLREGGLSGIRLPFEDYNKDREAYVDMLGYIVDLFPEFEIENIVDIQQHMP